MAVTPRHAEHVSLHFLGSESVLFDSTRQCLYATNTTATFIWCCLEEGMAPAAIAAMMVERFGMDTAKARVAIGQALRQWRTLKLMGSATTNGSDSTSVLRARSSATRAAVSVPGATYYRLLNSTIALRCPHPYARIVLPMLAALNVTDPVPCEALIEIAPDDSGCKIMVNDRIMECRLGPEELVPTLKAILVGFALEQSQDLAAFHAAGLARGGRCLLLPGASGRGKSTLSAALAMTGFELMSDDTMVLTEEDGLRIRAIPFGACLKTGAWTVLAERAPQIMDIPVHTRLDGVRVRYLLPPRLSLCGNSTAFPVGWIVFPHYVEGAALRMNDVPPPEALRRLTEGFCPLGAPLDAQKVERLVTWIAGIECHELRYGDLDEATALLQLLCA